MQGCSRLFRALVTAMSLFAWLAATDHCVLASVSSPQARVAGVRADSMAPACPMHQNQSSAPAQKQNDCAILPCCTSPNAVAAVATPLLAKPLWLGALVTFFQLPISLPAAPSAPPVFFADTGPPGERSFAERVLQRSVLAHAPPVSLS